MSTEKSVVKVVARGDLFGGLVDCYVDAKGGAYISQRGTLRALRGAEKGGGNETGNVGQFLGRLPNGAALLSAGTVSLCMPEGGTALGRPAQWFVDVLRAYKAAWRAGELHSSQVHLAENADRILDALAGVAIVAMVHEATGFEAQREQGFLSSLFARLFRPEPDQSGSKTDFWARMDRQYRGGFLQLELADEAP